MCVCTYIFMHTKPPPFRIAIAITEHSQGAHDERLQAPVQACNQVAETDGFEPLVQQEDNQQVGRRAELAFKSEREAQDDRVRMTMIKKSSFVEAVRESRLVSPRSACLARLVSPRSACLARTASPCLDASLGLSSVSMFLHAPLRPDLFGASLATHPCAHKNLFLVYVCASPFAWPPHSY
jgi:hypothetical protein